MEETLNPDALAADFKALAHEKRVRLLRFLVEPSGLEEIASHLGVARQTATEHVQQLLEVGLVARVDTRPDGRPGSAYVSVPHRVFHLYEMLGRLGDLEPALDEKVGYRLATHSDVAPAQGPLDQDLPRLTTVHGMRVGHTIVLSGQGPWLIGRDPSAAVCLDYDPYASARHAEVRRAPGGGFALADLYSSNGTALDWKPLERGAQVPLENGGIVRVGRTLLSFRRPAAK